MPIRCATSLGHSSHCLEPHFAGGPPTAQRHPASSGVCGGYDHNRSRRPLHFLGMLGKGLRGQTLARVCPGTRHRSYCGRWLMLGGSGLGLGLGLGLGHRAEVRSTLAGLSNY